MMEEIAEKNWLKVWSRISMAVLTPVFVFMLGYFANKLEEVARSVHAIDVNMAGIHGQLESVKWRLGQLENHNQKKGPL